MILSNSTPCRPPTILLSSWTKMRVAARLCIRDQGVNLTGTPRLALGLCSGSTNTFGAATTTHFVGVVTNNATLTRNAGPPVYYSGLNLAACKRVGSTLTTNASAINGGGSFMFAQPADGYRTLFFVDIEKGSPNYTMNAFYRNSSTGADVSADDFLYYAQLDTPSLTGYNFGTARTVAVDEGADGTLDHVNPAWSMASPQIEISDLAIVKLS